MTDDEVALIYDYLHENYEYRDGELIRTKEIHGSMVGRTLGTFRCYPDGNSTVVARFNINKKKYSKSLFYLIWLYHHKELPKYIGHIDGNKTNNKIENLIKCENRIIKKNTSKEKGYFLVKDAKSIRWRARITVNNKIINLGTYTEEKEAHAAYLKAKEEHREANT